MHQHASGGLTAGAELFIWADVTQLRYRTRRVSFVVLSSRPRTGFVLCRGAFGLLPFAAANGHGTMVLSVGWPPLLLLSSTGRSLFFLIQSCSSVCYRVSLLLLYVFSCFSFLRPWLLCFIKRSLSLFCIHFATQDSYLRKGL